jgi:hypothetical protein
MARLYAATGDGIARLDEAGEAWTEDCRFAGFFKPSNGLEPSTPSFP